jgi:hypothetical protein
LPAKLKAISGAGFEGIELSMPDILAYGKQVTGKDIDPKDFSALRQVCAYLVVLGVVTDRSVRWEAKSRSYARNTVCEC